MLAQHGLRVNASGIAEQRRHQQGSVRNPGFLQLGLQRRQHIALDHVQQRVVSGDLKPFAEQQLRGNFDVVTGTVV